MVSPVEDSLADRVDGLEAVVEEMITQDTKLIESLELLTTIAAELARKDKALERRCDAMRDRIDRNHGSL